eukprot:CAMPEP_0203745402 /NCGR_PEP_ID=MMETSP0098-20131031/1150_1 /ASSEMBLY_ACC=CAM_ASM_000208 /TAXON_ID=96639 /ORGANISM=" , Strain NY0313808BC1" /LENGTH=297 /DNA_ID=CAMNT_0050633171 /DNA_START=274 /DNA_END=1167 /DNA_ORIENTATION=+
MQTRGFAENLKDILNRINSTNNIQKITKSMKMVSAAKLRGDTMRLENGRAFGNSFNKVFEATATDEDTPLDAPKNPMYVVISSDRGLCGGVNSFVSKATKAAIDEDVAAGLNPKVMVIGDKGHAQILRTHGPHLVGQINECWKTPINFSKCALMVDRILQAGGKDADCVKIVYNKYVSAIRYDTEMKSCANYPVIVSQQDEEHNDLPFPLNKYEGELESTEESLENLFEHGLTVQLFGCMLESATSEQSARMSAMDGASKNAAEMVEKLTIKYNRARQAKITTELIEIISGAESLKG